MSGSESSDIALHCSEPGRSAGWLDHLRLNLPDCRPLRARCKSRAPLGLGVEGERGGEVAMCLDLRLQRGDLLLETADHIGACEEPQWEIVRVGQAYERISP